jgi:hypothetical protein
LPGKAIMTARAIERFYWKLVIARDLITADGRQSQ